MFARALGSDARIILMDDPMRGVDFGTKLEVYDLIRAEAERGRTFLWYTTEVEELKNCDRAYVFRNGAIVAELARDEPWLGVVTLIGCIALYAALGALIYLRNLPSIVVTLGMSFVWQGLAILLLPKPGGKAPGWLQALMGVKPPFIPSPIVAAVVIAGVGYFGLMRTSYGAILRASGGNALAIERAGWSLLRAKMTLFALAGVFGVLSGMALVGITTSADANIGNGYTLLSIAGVILGGGE